MLVRQDLPPGAEFGRVFANDTDLGLNGMVTYELMNHRSVFDVATYDHAVYCNVTFRDKFRIDTFTGGLFTVGKFLVADEQGMVYDLSVVASDRGRPSLR